MIELKCGVVLAGFGLLLGLTDPAGGTAKDSSVVGAPVCDELHLQPGQGWHPLTGSDDSIVIAAPTSFSPYDRGVAYMHGGSAWRSGDAVVELSYGYWAASSFANWAKACRARISGMPTIIIEERTSTGFRLLAWYQVSHGMEPLVAAWSTRAEDFDLLRSILWSVRRQSKKTAKGAP